MSQIDTIPPSLCQCGCGENAPIAKKSSKERSWEKGQPIQFVHGHNSRGRGNPQWRGGRIYASGYVYIHIPGHLRANTYGYVFEHVLKAERALGKPLPSGAVIHHVNEVKSDNKNNNLVICQDHTYHMLLHVRLRALRACGNPNFRKCAYCKKWDNPLHMASYAHQRPRHLQCLRDYQRERWRRLQTEKQGVLRNVSLN